jgi:hypothetical protein
MIFMSVFALQTSADLREVDAKIPSLLSDLRGLHAQMDQAVHCSAGF